jgi:facilitated trehalose transporter
MDTIGRRKTLLITEVPLVIGWALISVAVNVPMIYAGRLLTGLGSGMVGAPARVYTSEVTQPHLRGMLTALSSVCLSFGVLFQYTMGAFLSWNLLSAISCGVPIIALIGMMLLPESPNYLVSHQKPDDAFKSLAKLRGSSYNLQKEIDQLQAFADKTNSKEWVQLWVLRNNFPIENFLLPRKPSSKEILQALLAPSCLKPFGILVIYFMMYQFSGVNTITFYAVEIFQETGTKMDKNMCTILLGVIRFIFTIIGCIALRRCGRRPLSFVSGIGCGLTMLGLGTYLYYKSIWDAQGIPPMYTWIPVACIFLFITTCCLGFLVVPWVMIGELYPMKVRGIVGGMTTCAAHSFVFIVVKTYPLLAHQVQQHGAFMLYGMISLLGEVHLEFPSMLGSNFWRFVLIPGTVFFYFCLPETKGKTLQEIEDYFSGRISTLKSSKHANVNENNNRVTLMLDHDKMLNQKQWDSVSSHWKVLLYLCLVVPPFALLFFFLSSLTLIVITSV